MRPVIADLCQRLIAVGNDWRTFIRPHGGNRLTHIRDHIRILHHDLICLVAAEIRELLQHFLRCMQEQGCLIVSVVKALSRHDDAPVYLILRVEEMNVTGCNDRLVELLAELDDPPVDLLYVLDGINAPDLLRGDHELIVPAGLYLKVIIEIYQSGNLHIALSVQKRTVKLSRLAGAAEDQPLPILHHKALRYPRMTVEIGQMRLRNQAVQVDSPEIVLGKNDRVVGRQLSDQVHARRAHRIHLTECGNFLLRKHLDKLDKNPRCTLRVIHRPVMIFQRDIQSFRHRVQRML